MLKTIFLIGIGGGAGSILRYLVSIYLLKYSKSTLPVATLLVNILGCLAIGILLGILGKQQIQNPNIKYLLVIGFCGGFTTFSTFAAENIQLLQTGNFLTVFSYITVSILLCLIAVWLGLFLTK